MSPDCHVKFEPNLTQKSALTKMSVKSVNGQGRRQLLMLGIMTTLLMYSDPTPNRRWSRVVEPLTDKRLPAACPLSYESVNSQNVSKVTISDFLIHSYTP